MEIGLTMLGGDPDGLYRLPRAQQAQILGWWSASRMPAGWRQPKGRKRGLRSTVSTTDSGESFWLGGDS